MDKETIKNSMDFAAFYRSELGELKPVSNGNHLALCPFHDDSKPSLSVNFQDGLYKCFGCEAKGDVFDFYQRKHGCDFRTAFKELAAFAGVQDTKPKSAKKIVATYDYHDKDGNPLFQVVRYDPKSFRQRRPDGQGGWIWNMKGVEPVPYRLPEVLKAQVVIVSEGENDVENLRNAGFREGWAATCNPMGAGKWRSEYNEHFQGKQVIILPDNDTPGRNHAQDVARQASRWWNCQTCRKKGTFLTG
mgnify:CR=1 FL=1